MIAPTFAVRWPDSRFTEIWREVGKVTLMGRELNYECTRFSEIRWKNELWFCVYSVAEKEDSCNIIHQRQTFVLNTFSLPWAVTWSEGFFLACPFAPDPSSFRVGAVAWEMSALSLVEVGKEHSPGEEGGLFSKPVRTSKLQLSFNDPIDRKTCYVRKSPVCEYPEEHKITYRGI